MQRRTTRRWAVLVAAILGLSLHGCATLITGNAQLITVTSEPPGATVRLNGAPLGRTPLQVPVHRWEGGLVTCDLPGYHPASVAMSRSLNPVAILDLPWFLAGLLPGFVAVGIDIATGAIFELHPDPIAVTLAPLAPGPDVSPPEPRTPPVTAPPASDAPPTPAAAPAASPTPSPEADPTP